MPVHIPHPPPPPTVGVPKSIPPQSVPVTEEQVREILRRADRNRDGRLSKDELKIALRELGSRMACYRVRRCFKIADTNRDGQISAAELDNLVAYILKWHADKVKK